MHNSSSDIPVAMYRRTFLHIAKCQTFPQITQATQLQNFHMKNKKSMQPQKFSTVNDLHYTLLRKELQLA